MIVIYNAIIPVSLLLYLHLHLAEISEEGEEYNDNDDDLDGNFVTISVLNMYTLL